jgi:hypothetical protein
VILEQNNNDIVSENTIITEDITESLVEETDVIEAEVPQTETLEDEKSNIDERQEIIDLQLEFGRAHVATLNCNDYSDD